MRVKHANFISLWLVVGKDTIAQSLKNTVFNTIPKIVRKKQQYHLFYSFLFIILSIVSVLFYFIYNSNFKKA